MSDSDLDPIDPPDEEVLSVLWKSLDNGPGAFKDFVQSAYWFTYDQLATLLSVNAQGQNILHIAAQRDQIDVLRVLTHNMPRDLSMAEKLRTKLSLQGDLDGNTPLHVAALSGHIDMSKALLKYYAKIYIPRTLVDIPGEEAQEVDAGISTTPMSRYWSANSTEGSKLIHLLTLGNNAGKTASAEALGHTEASTRVAEWLRTFRAQFDS